MLTRLRVSQQKETNKKPLKGQLESDEQAKELHQLFTILLQHALRGLNKLPAKPVVVI